MSVTSTNESSAACSVAPAPMSPSGRVLSIDVLRGLVMVALISNNLGLAEMGRRAGSDLSWLAAIGQQFEHVPWAGCRLWDLIQPAFMFLVGVAIPYSVSRRQAAGQSPGDRWVGAVRRAILLIVLGVVLVTFKRQLTSLSPVPYQPHLWNVLTQIGLGYLVVFALCGRHWLLQISTAVVILGAYGWWFASAPLPPPDFDRTLLGVPADWPHRLVGFFEHWDLNVSPAAQLDLWLFNQLPRSAPYQLGKEGYTTLNFIPSIATMLAGLLAGEWLRRTHCPKRASIWLIVAGAVLSVAGWQLEACGICPIVKRIWTPAWAVYSSGLVLAALGMLHGLTVAIRPTGRLYQTVIDFLRVAGSNAILLYLLSETTRPWITMTMGLVASVVGLHDARQTAVWWPLGEGVVVLASYWSIAWWLDRRGIYLRI